MSIKMQIIETKKGKKAHVGGWRHSQFTNFHKPIKLKSKFPKNEKSISDLTKAGGLRT